MKTIALSLACFLLISGFAATAGFADSAQKDTDLKLDVYKQVDVNKEDKEVGLKRMELIDKSLSRDLMERKRELVKELEGDYNKKIGDLVDSIIPPMFKNRVMTHIDVNYFASDFDTQVRASQKVSVALVIKRDGFNTWVEQNSSKESATQSLKQLINGTFKITQNNISILVVD